MADVSDWPQVGDPVIYRPYDGATAEDGVVTGRSSDGTLAYVRYRGQHPSADGKATSVALLSKP